MWGLRNACLRRGHRRLRYRWGCLRWGHGGLVHGLRRWGLGLLLDRITCHCFARINGSSGLWLWCCRRSVSGFGRQGRCVSGLGRW